MNMPKGYNDTQAFSDWTPLAPGGYVCKIVKVEETESRNGNPMLKIALDIAEGSQANRFHEQFWNDDRADKRWPCVAYQVVAGRDGLTARGFKGFNISVAKSNDGWREVWGDAFCENYKGKLVGVIFGREQYKNRDGELRWSTKPQVFRSVDAIRNGDFQIPADKYLQDSAAPAGSGDDFPDGFRALSETEFADLDVPF